MRRVAAEVGAEAAGGLGEVRGLRAKLSRRLAWWGVGERRESRRRSFCSDSGVRRRDSVRLLGLAGAVVDGRWGAGEGQGAFKKG